MILEQLQGVGAPLRVPGRRLDESDAHHSAGLALLHEDAVRPHEGDRPLVTDLCRHAEETEL